MFLGFPHLDPSLFVRIRILPSTSKKVKRNLIYNNLLLLYDFLLLKTDVNVPSKKEFKKKLMKKQDPDPKLDPFYPDPY